RWSCLSRRSLRLPKTPVSKRLSMGVPVGSGLDARNEADPVPWPQVPANEKRAPGALFGNGILYVETPAGGIKADSGPRTRVTLRFPRPRTPAVGRGCVPAARDRRLRRRAEAARDVGGV